MLKAEWCFPRAAFSTVGTEGQTNLLPQNNQDNIRMEDNPQTAAFAAPKMGEKKAERKRVARNKDRPPPPVYKFPSSSPLYLGGIEAKKREEHQGLQAPFQDPHLPERVLGVDLFLFDHLPGLSYSVVVFLETVWEFRVESCPIIQGSTVFVIISPVEK
ncbi:uncharacterized protein LOC133891267 isoform X2 [Phragmites australis]|uniref:uncharacterized protein LOC133891267 isoform X2 n=1 Tax=Phragmites australis TaxID=29695 RepID=UPI002D784983|nr:uncharacterized protein LOC133891267 isoform X2 [Phragmites australis]